ncbi:MAG: efflux RND transporter permease subunit [Candidatus Euphemobacter frigidus]|nr:efflux RND transporter permease subunit [Candidatus Euphemobacter frigidus]
MFLSDLSIKRHVLMTVIILIMLLLGGVAYLQLPVDLFPKIEIPYVTVITTYLGAGPREIETLVSKPLEEELSTIDGLKHVKSISQEGISLVSLEFELAKDLDVAAADVRDKVALVEPELPDAADKPLISKFDINAQPILQLAVSGKRSPRSLYLFTDNKIKPQFAKIKGVAEVEIIGGQEREIVIAMDQQRMNAYHLTPDNIITAIEAANLELPSGHITQDRIEFTVRLAGKVTGVDLLGSLYIPTPDGGKVRITELGMVDDTVKEIRERARFQNQETLGLIIKKRADANTIEVADRVMEGIDSLKKRLPPDITIEIAEDRSAFIRGSLNEVRDNMIIGIVLTAISLFLFLHNIRSTLILIVAMPTSIISTFLLLFIFNYSINVMSMMGLALSVGILVNNSILVLENIHRYLELGNDRVSAARRGTSEIAAAVASTTLTNIVVFVPIAFMSSIVGQFFRQFAMTIVFSTIFSLFISYTLTPMLSSKYLKESGNKASIFRHWDNFYISISRSYGNLVRRLLRHRWPVVIVSFIVLIVSMKYLPPLIGFEFFSKTDQGSFKVMIETPVDSPLATTDRVTRQVESILRELPEQEKIFTTVGKVSGFLGGTNQGVNLAGVNVDLVDEELRERTTREVMNSLRSILAEIPAATFTLQETQQGGPGAEKPIQLEIRGDEIETLNRLAGRAVELARTVPGAVDVDTDWRMGKPEIWIIPDRQRASEYGITVGQIAEILRSSLTGVIASTYREMDDEFDIRVKLEEKDRNFQEQIRHITLRAKNGEVIPLTAVGRIEQREGPTTITRKDRERMVTVSANVVGSSSGEVYSRLKELIDTELRFPSGYGYFFAGEIERMQENFREIFIALGLAVVLTYLMLAAILESYRYPTMIMLSLPLAMIAVFLALFLTDTTINIFSLMAMVMLVGLVINNTIVIVDYSNLLRKEGKSIEDAIVGACEVRLRPVLMANMTTVVAMIPLALGLGMGGGFRAPMAIVSIGGMIGGGLLALLVSPVLYLLFSSTRQQMGNKKNPG